MLNQSNHIMFSTAQKSDKELNAVNNTHIYNIMQTMKSYRPLVRRHRRFGDLL